MSEILVVGSVAYDTISTPEGKVHGTLGGSANYFSLAASLYSDLNVVGIVGEDYKEEDFQLLKDRRVNLDGLQKANGKTFHWEGKYEDDMNEAITLETQLNVFEHFDPILPGNYIDSSYVFLANIDPDLQMKVFNQIKNPKFVGLDTMNLWIDIKREGLKKILKKVDVLLCNEGEAKQLAGHKNGVKAIKILSEMGPKSVVVKRGEYGFMLYKEGEYFVLPAYPIENLVDPTGAGDTFAGGFFGYLSKVDKEINMDALKQACIHGCLLSSFTVEGFGLSALKEVTPEAIKSREEKYQRVISYL